MSLDREDIEKLCLLARLNIATEEMADVQAKLSDIVKLGDQLQAVETDGVTPMAHPLDHGQRLRSDEVTEIDEHAHIQLNAPHVKRGHYLVPKVIE